MGQPPAAGPLFIQAAHFTPARRTRVDLVVLHTMESQERPDTARGVAAWFAGAAKHPAPKASAHYCIDNTAVVQCVKEEDVAWAAPGANSNGVQLEMAGRANQTPEQWADAYSTSMLELSAQLCAQVCRRWEIPAVLVGPAGLRMGRRGITTHAAVTAAFGKSTHTDPGAGFPIAQYVARVAALLRQGGQDGQA